MRLGILTEHGFKNKGNHYATLPWFGTKIAKKHAKRIKTKTWGTQVFVATWNATFSFSTSGQRQVTTCCACAVTSRKKCHVSGCRRQAGDVCCLRCPISRLVSHRSPHWATCTPDNQWAESINHIHTYSRLTTVFVDTRLWKTKHPRKRFQNFRHSCVVLTDGIEIHQSQPDSMM